MNEIQKSVMILMAWSKPLFYINNRKTHETSSTFKDTFLPKQVTRGHNIFSDGWAGASNLHPHPYLNPQTQTYTNKYPECLFSHFFTWSLWTDRPTERWTNGQSLYMSLSPNKSSKKRTWSAVPDALLRVISWRSSESRAAAPKGRCPVGHRGELAFVLRGHIWGIFP